MSTHAIGTKGRLRPAAVGIVLASAIDLDADGGGAVGLVGIDEGHSAGDRPDRPYAAKDDKRAS